MARFLSDDWFAQVDKIRSEVGEIEVADLIKDLVINILVTGHPDGDKQLHVAGGDFQQGHAENAPTKMILPFEVASAMFINGDQAVVMQAFMSGQIQVEGDMAAIMQMQAAGEPSQTAKDLQERVKAITEI
jgi:putative sterol carrier protein